MKKSKQAKASERVDEVDRVSDLPDPILHLILSGLPTTEEIIRSSVLSRRWRYLWTSIPRVDIDFSRGLNGEQTWNRLKEYKFTEFVYWILLNKSLDLDSFRLSCETCYSMSTVGRWIHAAVTRNVKQLHLEFRPIKESRNEYENIEMPHCLVTCSSLEELRLFLRRGRLILPKFTGFPSLRVLELNDVELLDADIVKAFFTTCLLLEDLTLIDCMIDTLEFLCISCQKLKYLRIDNRIMDDSEYLPACGDLQISCPKLVFLELLGPIAYHFSFDSLNSLKKAVIHPEFLESEPENDTDTVCELFARISHLESLSISLLFLLECIDPEVNVPVSLPNLKTLELTLDCGEVDVALRFLKCLPALESLHLNINSHTVMENRWKLNEVTTMRIWSRQLKRVVFGEFSGKKWELEIACFFLEHGKALEEMVFSWDDEAEFNERSKKTMEKVSNFHKASPTVKLIAVLKPWTVPTTFVVQRD